jgi:hypothetical protein
MESVVYLGVDIGKSGHYAMAVDATGKLIYQTSVVNDEQALRKLVDWAKERQASAVVDQPGGAAALLLKLCWQSEVRIEKSGLIICTVGDGAAREFYAGESKTDPKDAFVLADVAPGGRYARLALPSVDRSPVLSLFRRLSPPYLHLDAMHGDKSFVVVQSDPLIDFLVG